MVFFQRFLNTALEISDDKEKMKFKRKMKDIFLVFAWKLSPQEKKINNLEQCGEQNKFWKKNIYENGLYMEMGITQFDNSDIIIAVVIKLISSI